MGIRLVKREERKGRATYVLRIGKMFEEWFELYLHDTDNSIKIFHHENDRDVTHPVISFTLTTVISIGLILCGFISYWYLFTGLLLWQFPFGSVYITLNSIVIKEKEQSGSFDPAWGFSSYHEASGGEMIFRWNKRYYTFYYPWALEYHRTSYLFKNNTWFTNIGYKKSWKNSKGIYKRFEDFDEEDKQELLLEEFNFHDTRQDVKTKVTTYQRIMVWRRKWLPFTDLFSFKKHEVDMEFANPIGYRVGTWKGGTVGMSRIINKGETTEDVVRRVELEEEYNINYK
jgi:hypothetical protein